MAEEAANLPGPYDGFKPGARDSFDRLIKTIIGRHRHMVVYITSDGAVGWDYQDLPERLRPAVVEFQTLEGLAKFCLSEDLYPTATNLLAKALYAGLLCKDGQNPIEKFEEVRGFIVERARGRARLYYILWSLLFVSLSGSLILYHSQWHMPGIPLVGILGGLLGSLISIIQRGSKLPVDPLCSVAHLALQGFIRLVLGAIFGAFLVSASKADLTLGNFSEDTWALFGFSVAAGFSERFVPDLLKNTLEKAA
jgi:hypothetical protein